MEGEIVHAWGCSRWKPLAVVRKAADHKTVWWAEQTLQVTDWCFEINRFFQVVFFFQLEQPYLLKNGEYRLLANESALLVNFSAAMASIRERRNKECKCWETKGLKLIANFSATKLMVTSQQSRFPSLCLSHQVQLIDTKTIENRKGDRAWGGSGW